ncbi:MAG TPA: GatB/YqeY domain-containing protein, partial [Gammaproteobacteria bacterium]|nr:GatB/YqeY domain-containing protein [Gammaproteobacteria bacterium]
KDSIAQYEAAQRMDLADIEKGEVSILMDYMPQPLNDAEITALITETIVTSGAQGVRDMGKVMSILKLKLAGRADMTKVSVLIKERLSG